MSEVTRYLLEEEQAKNKQLREDMRLLRRSFKNVIDRCVPSEFTARFERWMSTATAATK